MSQWLSSLIAFHLESDGTCKLKHSCRVVLKIFIRMTNLCQSSIALIHNLKSGSIWYLENGVIVVFKFNRSHHAAIVGCGSFCDRDVIPWHIIRLWADVKLIRSITGSGSQHGAIYEEISGFVVFFCSLKMADTAKDWSHKISLVRNSFKIASEISDSAIEAT